MSVKRWKSHYTILKNKQKDVLKTYLKLRGKLSVKLDNCLTINKKSVSDQQQQFYLIQFRFDIILCYTAAEGLVFRVIFKQCSPADGEDRISKISYLITPAVKLEKQIAPQKMAHLNILKCSNSNPRKKTVALRSLVAYLKN